MRANLIKCGKDALIRRQSHSIPFTPDWGYQIDGSLVQNGDYNTNKENMSKFVQELRDATMHCHKGGGEKAIAKHRLRGKMLARERIDNLVDKGSPFLELSTLAGEHDSNRK